MRGVRLIVGYKFAKALAEILLAFVLFRFLSNNGPDVLLLAAKFSRRHVASVASLSAAKWLLQAKPLRLYYTDLALVLDGTLALIEGISLDRGYTWAPWFVVCATGLPLPFEFWEIVRRPRAGRELFFCANVLIVWYLGRRASAHASAR